MPSATTARLEELTKLATDFVTAQKGFWDHAAWTDFISGVQGRGFDISEEMQSHLGNLLEAIKQFYNAAASTKSIEKALQAIVDEGVDFVKLHKGAWGHAEWEEFVRNTQRNTLDLSERTMAYLGGVLESIKVFYRLSPVAEIQEMVPSVQAEPVSAEQPAIPAPIEPKPEPTVKEAPAPTKASSTPVSKGADRRDDLTLIGGIGPALAKKLNGAGISSYAQLAALSDEDVLHLEKNVIKFTGRIRRDDWVGQAKRLAEEQTTA